MLIDAGLLRQSAAEFARSAELAPDWAAPRLWLAQTGMELHDFAGALKLAEAIEAYTMGSAFAEFQENEKGSITPGKLADMVLLSQDIFSIEPEKIRQTKVVKTFVGGKLVWDANANAGRN